MRGIKMKTNKDFMDCWDYSTEELLDMVDLIIYLKAVSYTHLKSCI